MPNAVGQIAAQALLNMGASAAFAASVNAIVATVVKTVLINTSLSFTDENGESWESVDATPND